MLTMREAAWVSINIVKELHLNAAAVACVEWHCDSIVWRARRLYRPPSYEGLDADNSFHGVKGETMM